MAERDNGTVRDVKWSQLFPWLIVARAFPIALQPRQLALGAAGLLLMFVGWAFWAWALGGATFNPWTRSASLAVAQPISMQYPLTAIYSGPIYKTWQVLSEPLAQTFSTGMTLKGAVQWMLSAIWTIAVWAFLGGMITRSASLQLAAGQRDSLTSTVRFVGRRWLHYFGAPLIPLVGVLLVSLPLAVAGLLLHFNAGVLLAAIVWPLLLVGGFLIALLLLGLLFGWPLLWANLSTEGVDAFDSVGRMYNYTYLRPLHYLFYAVVAALLGALSWILVSQFANGVVAATYWAASWGAGGERVGEVAGGHLAGLGAAGASLIFFWIGCVKILAAGFLFSYFWASASAIYLLLRRNVDDTEMDEVAPEQEEIEQGENLPPIGTDSAGAPVVADGQQAEDRPLETV